MANVHNGVDEQLRCWISEQPMFVVATAPVDGTHVNLSPKGEMHTLVVRGRHRLAYLDLTGSGCETIAHVRENRRITIMFCSFSRTPRVVRIYGKGDVHLRGSVGFTELTTGCWPDWHSRFPSARAVIDIQVSRVSESGGFGVPIMASITERTLLRDSANRHPYPRLVRYWKERNGQCIDELPAMGQYR